MIKHGRQSLVTFARMAGVYYHYRLGYVSYLSIILYPS